MAATRSPLRIRPVPEMPSSAASRCSSGSSIPDRPLPRRRGLPVVPEAAGASLVPGASCAPVPARSVVSLTYRSFPAVTCAYQRRGCPVPAEPGPEAERSRKRVENLRGGSAAKRDRLLRPRARLARVGGYRVSLDAAHGLDNSGGYRPVPRYEDDTCWPRLDTVPPSTSTSSPSTVHPGGVNRFSRPSAALLSGETASTSTLGPAPETTAACPSARSRSTRSIDSGIAAARCRWCRRSSVASYRRAGSALSAWTSSAARAALY